MAILFVNEYRAQPNDSLYNVSVNVGFGYSRYLASLPKIGLNKNSFNITGRIMWEPEHLLSVGVETGYVPLFFFQTNDYKLVDGSVNVDLSLVAIPVVIIFGMEIFEDFKIYAGVGGAALNSTADFFENKVVSSSWSNAYNLSVAYSHKIAINLNLGSEIKWYNISKIEDSALLVQISILYNVFSY
ncbi:MAG: hypothetical protein KDC90_09030 [Ignavibacteriae bacterium]|nr:hypothetical protein [Ignavibacteriota bacterium]